MTAGAEKKHAPHQLSGRLRELCFELQGLAYLIGNQRTDEVPPLDMQETHFGVGRVLSRLAGRLQKLSDAAEELEKRLRD